MKRLIGAILLLAAGNFYAFGQRTEEELKTFINKASESELVKESTFLVSEGYFRDAEKVVDKLLEKKPGNINYNYRKGYILVKKDQAYAEALPYLLKGTAQGAYKKNYDIYSSHEDKAPVDVLFYTAYCYHQLEDIDQALKFYKEYTENSIKASELVNEANLHIKQCNVAKQLMASPERDVVIKNIGQSINTEYPEYASIISPDGQTLFFTSRRPWESGESEPYYDPKTNLYPEDIYVSYLMNNEWSRPERLSIDRSETNEATVSLNVKENLIYTYNDESGSGDIYYSVFDGKEFKTPEKVQIKGINSEYWEPHLAQSADGNTIYFVSARPGGYGGRDIYEITKKSNGSWTEPRNLGPEINTPYDEDAPFISADGEEFFFSSNGEKSMGGFDIFFAKRNSDGTLSGVKNAGYPLNSCGDDLYYTVTEEKNARKGYFSSSRKGGYGEKDIYFVSSDKEEDLVAGIPPVKEGGEDTGNKGGEGNPVNPKHLVVNFKDENNKIIPDARVEIECIDCLTTTKDQLKPDKDGTGAYTIEPGKTYKVNYISGKDHSEKKETLLIGKDTEYKDILRDFRQRAYLAKFTKFFGYNAYQLENEKELSGFKGDLANVVKAHSEITVEIYSSASKVPTKTFKNNGELAKLRAQNMKNEIEEYISSLYPGVKVEYKIVEAIVSGPEYKNDASNKQKYAPAQYARILVK